ncbi:glycosyltransferase family 39 protein [Candidatus Gracilibacteria bacterium]|nr:glycosyltransferase family 39 protein [Candidatus Gracilibacteria bacterium]NJM87231.1 glycosyltransferase family 39 protein [Hydrococcus sp. RU_2_2]
MPLRKFYNFFNSEFHLLLVLSIAALFLWLIALGNLPLRDWDEGYYGVVARDVFRTGNWIYLTYLDKPFLLKPPLMMWLIAISYHWGGLNEFTTRLPGAFLTACGVPLLYLLGREVFSNRLSAIFSSGVYLTLLPIVRHGRLAMLDGAINTFFILALWCLLKARHDCKWAIGFGIGMGAIALTKGILVLALGAIAGLFILVNKQAKLLLNPYLWLGILLGFLPVLTWYLTQIQQYGNLFIKVHFQSQSFDRLSTSLDGHQREVWYYFIELVKYTIPWLLFLPGGLSLAWQQRAQSWSLLVLTASILYMGTISIMGTKLPWYIMPIYPFFALAIGVYLEQLWQNEKKYSKSLFGFFIFLAIAALGSCVYFILSDPQPVLIVMSIVLMLTMILTAWKVQNSDRNFIPILFVGFYITLLLFVTSKSWVWELNETFPVKHVANLIQTHVPPKTEIYTSFAYERPSLDFYSDRRVTVKDLTSLQQLKSKKAYLLLDKAALETLQLPNSLSLGTAEGFTLLVSQPNS